MKELADRIEATQKELAYVQITTTVSVPSVAAASAVTVVSAGAITFEAVPIMVEFFSPLVVPPQTVVSNVKLSLWDGSTDLGDLGNITTPSTSAMGVPVRLARRLTPSAASHTYIVKAYASAAGGDGHRGRGRRRRDKRSGVCPHHSRLGLPVVTCPLAFFE